MHQVDMPPNHSGIGGCCTVHTPNSQNDWGACSPPCMSLLTSALALHACCYYVGKLLSGHAHDCKTAFVLQ